MFVHIRQTDPCNQSWPHCYCSCWCWCLHCCCVCCCTAAVLKQVPSQGGKSDWEGLHFAHQIILLGKNHPPWQKKSSLAQLKEKSLEEVAKLRKCNSARGTKRSTEKLNWRKSPMFWYSSWMALLCFSVFLLWLCGCVERGGGFVECQTRGCGARPVSQMS